MGNIMRPLTYSLTALFVSTVCMGVVMLATQMSGRQAALMSQPVSNLISQDVQGVKKYAAAQAYEVNAR